MNTNAGVNLDATKLNEMGNQQPVNNGIQKNVCLNGKMVNLDNLIADIAAKGFSNLTFGREE
jgi:hypothetical protein